MPSPLTRLLAIFPLGVLACSSVDPLSLVEGAAVVDERMMAHDSHYRSSLGVHDLLAEGDRLWLVHYRYEAGGIVEHPDPDLDCPGCPANGVATPGAVGNLFSMSEDGGRTWTARPSMLPWAFPRGLFRAGERVFAQGWQASTGAGSQRYYYYELRELDPGSLAPKANASLDTLALRDPLRQRGSRLSGASLYQAPNSTTVSLSSARFDAATGDLSYLDKTVAPPACMPAWRLASGDGERFVGLCVDAGSEPARVCHIELLASTLELSSTCTPLLHWPLEYLFDPNANRSMESNLGPVWVSARADPLTGGSVLAQVRPGEEWPRLWRLPAKVSTSFEDDHMHPLGAGLLRLEDGRFVELLEDGGYALVTFRRSVCAKEEACAGRTSLRLLHALGGNRYLVFYAMDDEEHHQRLVALPQEATRVVVPAPPPLVGNERTLRDTAAAVTAPVDRVCMLASVCTFVAFSDCRSFLSGGSFDQMDTARLAAAQTCPELLAAWPGLSVLGERCPSSRGGAGRPCIKGFTTLCSGGYVLLGWSECGDDGMEVCSPTVACSPTNEQRNACLTSTAVHSATCEGGVATYPCSPATLRHDCAFLGKKCDVSSPGGCRDAPENTTGMCDAIGWQCDGAVIVLCLKDAFHRLDCRDFGKERCTPTTGGQRAPSYCE